MTQEKFLCVLLVLFVVLFWPQYSYQTKAEEKENYLVLLARSDVKPLYKGFIEEKESKYNVYVEVLEENQVLNKPENIQNFLAKKWQELNVKWVAIDEKVNIPINSYTVNGYTTNYASLSNYWDLNSDKKPDVYVGVIRRNTLKTWEKLPNISGTFASEPVNYDRYTKGTCCDTGVDDFSQPVSTIAQMYRDKGYQVNTLFETESTWQPLVKPTLSLNVDNFSMSYCSSNLIWANSTVEPIKVWGKKWESNFYALPTRAVHIDKDGNGHVDNFNAEIQNVEIYWTPQEIQDNKKRIVILSQIDGVKNINLYPDYVVIANSTQEGKIEFEACFVEQLLNGKTVAQAVEDSYEILKEKYPDTRNLLMWLEANVFSWVVYGSPETTLQDIIELPDIQLVPEKVEELSLIEISSTSPTEFSIKNIGSQKVDILIEFDQNVIDVSPCQFVLEPNQTGSITISLKKLIGLLSTRKTKTTKLTIHYGNRERKVTIKWFGV